MTISDNYQPDVTIGNGATTVFTGSWSPLVSTNMRVALELISTGVQTLQVLGVDYTLTFSSSGYSVTMTTAPSSLYNVVRYRDVAIDQNSPYSTSQGFQGLTIEQSFDKLTAIAQDQQDVVNRALSLPVGSSADSALPPPEANKLIGWNAGANGLENYVSTTGTSLLAQSLYNAVVSVESYGAVGDGVTNDTTAITNAVAAAYAQGAILRWSNDNTYLTTASIPNFHDVIHEGRAIVKRGTDLWYISPPDVNTDQKLYYNLSSGSNANDGLSASEPRQTLAQFQADILRFSGLGLLRSGFWQFYFTGSATNTGVNLGGRIIDTAQEIRLNFTNVTLTHNTSSTLDAFFSFGDGIFTIDGTLTLNGNLTTNIYGMSFRVGEYRIKSTATVTINDCQIGLYADDGCLFNQDSETTSTDGCITGAEWNNSNGTDYSTHSNCSYGTTAGRVNTMHVKTVVNDATVAALFINHCNRVDIETGNDWNSCAVGLLCYDSAVASIGSANPLETICNMGTADACTIMAQFFGSSSHGWFHGNSAFPIRRIGHRADTLTLTGTTDATVLGAIYGTTTTGIKPIPAYFFADKGKQIIVRVYGNITGTAGTHTISLRSQPTAGGAIGVIASRSLSTSAGEFMLEFRVSAVAYNSQKFEVSGVFGGGTAILANGTSAIDFSVQRNLQVFGELGDSADTITVEGISMDFVG